MQASRLLTKPAEVKETADALAKCPAIAVDTEFIRETTFYPKIALIQVATREESWLLDPVVLSKDDLAPLFTVLKDPKILKIMHAAHADQECFYTRYGFLVAPVLDSAVAAALLGMGDNLGLAKLLRDLVNVTLPKGRARVRWLQRPLPGELLEYAALDVAHLVELGEILLEKLKGKGRTDWALEASEIPSDVFDMTPEDFATKVSKSGHFDAHQFPILVELFRWREHRAKSADLPRGWVADNETLVALCKSRPKSIDELKQFRGLNPKEVERSGKAILDAIQRGRQAPPHRPERTGATGPRNEREDHILDFLHTYVALLAARHEIAGRFLLSSHRSPALLRYSDKSPEEWVSMGLVTEHASRLIGTELKALLDGKRALTIKAGEVRVLDI